MDQARRQPRRLFVSIMGMPRLRWPMVGRKRAPPPMSEASHRPVVPYFEIVAAFLLVWAVVRLLRFRYGRQRRNVVAAKLAAEDASFVADEDAQARYRLTGARLAKALPASGEFDAVLVGSGPGSLGCAAALSQMGYKCCVLEQGEQLGGGAHVFSDVGYEFETGVHYLGNDEAMKGMQQEREETSARIARLEEKAGKNEARIKQLEELTEERDVKRHAGPTLMGLGNR